MNIPTAAVRRSRTRQRRFLMVAVAGLAVVGVAMGVSFLDASGTTSTSVSAASNSFVFPVAASTSSPLPCKIVNLKYTTSAGITAGSCSPTVTQGAFKTSGVVLPSWTPVGGSAGSVTTAGDLAVIDATTGTLGPDHGTLLVSMYITNLDKLQQDYSSFAFPVNVYSSTDGTGWAAATSVLPTVTYLTYSTAFLSFSMPAGYYYDITFDTGGSFYTTSTTAGSLNPSFFFTAQPA